MKKKTFKSFLSKVRQEWKVLTEDGYYENEDLNKSAKNFSGGILERKIEDRLELLKIINSKVMEQTKIEMDRHLEIHNLYKKTIEDYVKKG